MHTADGSVTDPYPGSRLSTAPSWSSTSERRALLLYWLETGKIYLDTTNSCLRFGQIWAALKTYKSLPNTFIYLLAFFLLADVRVCFHVRTACLLIALQGLNTTGTLISICQNDKFQFSFLQNTYLGLAQAITSTISTLGFWYIQKYWKVSTKKMFVVTNVFSILIPLWGMMGLWTSTFGFHNVCMCDFRNRYPSLY